MSKHGDLVGHTILLVEDEPLIALDVEMALQDAGAVVVGPARDRRSAMNAIDSAHASEDTTLSGAVLDVHLGGHTCEQVAERLLELRIPFVFHTGNLRDNDRFIQLSGAPVVRKPALAHDLVAALQQIV